MPDGFRIGHSYAKGLVPLNAQKNMLSAQQHQEVVDTYINKEVAEGRVLGPFSSPGQAINTSPFGVIPKRHQQNKCMAINFRPIAPRRQKCERWH